MEEAAEKTFTESEIMKVITRLGDEYTAHYNKGKMNFNELMLVENVFIKLQWGLRFNE